MDFAPGFCCGSGYCIDENQIEFDLLGQKHKGVTSARLAGLEYASGECITFVDADDWVEYNHIEVLASAMSEQNDLVETGLLLVSI